MNFERQASRPLRSGQVLVWLVLLPTGGCAGFWYHQNSEPVYVSEGTFRIIQNGSVDQNDSVRHDRLIDQEGLVDRCFLEKTGLRNLPSFDAIAGDEVLRYVVDNLDVRPDESEPSVYHINYHCSKPDDARTVINNLLIRYSKELRMGPNTGDLQQAWRLKLHEQLNQYQIEDKQFRDWIFDFIQDMRPSIQTEILSQPSSGKLVSPDAIVRVLYGIGIGFLMSLFLVSIRRILR